MTPRYFDNIRARNISRRIDTQLIAICLSGAVIVAFVAALAWWRIV